MSWKGAANKGSKDSKNASSWGGDSWQQEGGQGDSWKKSWDSKSQGNGNSWGQASGDSWGQSASSKSQGKSSQGWNERPVVRPPAKHQDQAADQGWKRPSDSWEQEPAWKKTATDSKGKSKGEAKGGYGDAKGGYGDAKGGYGGKSKGETSDAGKSKGDTKGATKGAYTDAKGGKGYGAKSADPVATFKAKVEKMTKDYDTAEKVTNTTLEVAKKTLENEKATPAAIKSQVDSCDRMSKKALEIQDTLFKDCEEAKKAGTAVKDSHTELTKLLAKAKSLVHQIHAVTEKLKPKLAKAQHDQEMSAKEAKDSAAFKPLLTKASQAVAAVEAAVAPVAKKAAPVIDSPPEGEELTEVATGIETAAKEALQKVEAAKGDLKEKFNAIQSYAPEARKSANSSLMELQKKLTEMSNQMRLYQAFKKELPKLLEAKKTVEDISEKFTTHEAEVAKASKLAEAATLTKEDAKQIDEIFDTVSEAISTSTKLVHQTMRFSDAGTKATLTKLQTKGEELRKQMQAINAKIKKQKDVFTAADVGEIGEEKLKKVEDGVKACQAAEMPYLTGVEVLPDDESDKVLKECNDASEAATTALHDAKTWLSKKLAEAKSMEKELSDKMITEVNELMKRIGKPEAQLSKFKKDMSDRRTTAIMNSAVGGVKELEAKVKAMESDCKALKASSLEEESDETLKDAVDKTRKVLIDVNTAVTETKKMLQSKQKEARAHNNDPAVKSMFDRVEAANSKVRTFQQAIGAGEKILKARSAVTAGEEKVKELEAEVEKAKKLVPAEGAKLALESVAVLDELFKSIETMCKGVSNLLSPVVRDAPAKAKTALQELLKRKDEAQKGSGTVWKDIKDARDEALSASYVSEAEENTKAVEAASAGIEEAEKPFLIGSSLSLKDRQEALKKCEEGVSALQKALGIAKKHADDKTWEAKRFGEAAAKKLKEAFAAMADRKKQSQQKLDTYQKDLKERNLASKMLEAEEKVDTLETEAKKTAGLAEPFTKEGADKMTEEEAAEPLKAFMEADAATSKSIAESKHFVAGRMRDEKGKEENMKILKTLQERLDKVVAELATVKKSTAPFERRSLGKRMVAEATELVGGLEAEIKKAKDKCAPIMEKEGIEFLVCSSITALTKALSSHMKAKTVTVEDLWKEANGGKAMKEATFVKYVAGLPEAIGADSLSCLSDERRIAMFKKLIEGKKTFDEAAFKAMFDSRYNAGEECILSSGESPESETVCKIQKDDVVVFIGEAKDVGKGLWRQQCKFGDKEGWVTTNNDKGRRRFFYYTEYKHFCFLADGVIHESGNALSKVVNNVASTLKQCGTAEDDSLKDAKEKLTKLKEDASAAHKSFEEFKKAFGQAKRDFQSKEKAELNAHIDAKNQKEAAPFLEGPKGKVEAVEAAAKAAEEAGSSMVALTGDDLLAFATPGTVSVAVEKSVAETTQKAAEAKEAIKEQQKAVGDVKPGTGGTAEAAKQLKVLSWKVDEAVKNVTKMSATVKKQCRTIVDPKMGTVAEALRKHAEEKGMSAEGLFDSLKDGEKIPEAAFCSLVASLEGASCNAEVAKLIAQKLEADGISKNAFIGFVVVYYKVVKGIAFTDEVDISKCKTLRKADLGEVLEALGSPVVDESNGMTRVRCKALQAPPCEGWVTLAGNQGTTFLEKTAKP